VLSLSRGIKRKRLTKDDLPAAINGTLPDIGCKVSGEVEGVEPVRDELCRRRAKMMPGMSASNTTTTSRLVEERKLARDDRFVQ
jgi:hypothetical protein